MHAAVLDAPPLLADPVQAPAIPAPERPLPASRLPVKAPHADLRRYYGLTFQLSLALALLGVIALMKLNLAPDAAEDTVLVAEQEVVQMEEIQQTTQPPKVPPPPQPQAALIVADDALVEEVELTFDATLDVGEALAELPPPPPMPPPEETAAEIEAEPEIFVVVEQMPRLIGGLAGVQERIEYPEVARLAAIEGKVIVQFVVDEEGRVRDPVVLRGIGGGCDEEAVRAVLQARFEPGRQRGKAVRVRYVVPIIFKLR